MLEDKIYNLLSFQRQLQSIVVLSICDTISNLEWSLSKTELLKVIDWNNVLGIASVLSYSNKNEHLDAALRIAQTCLSHTCSPNQKTAAVIILENLTNKPAISLAISRNLISSNYKNDFPLLLNLQSAKINIENSIVIDQSIIQLNKFQKKVFDIYENFQTISISAPTSAGKSYILYRIIFAELLKQKTNIIYLVPTRALISQVETDLRGLLKGNNVICDISTIPQFDSGQDLKSNIFVFTQERLHWFLIQHSDVIVDILIVDEAQKINDGNRGILLQQKIEEIVENNENLKVYFSSPFTSNPELLLENINNDSKKDKVNTQFVAVNQNLLYITQVPRKVEKWEVYLCTIEKKVLLGYVNLKDRPSGSEFKKLVFISEIFSGGKGGNLIYSNGSADSEKVALILYDLLENNKNVANINISELIKLVKNTIHSEYALAKVLEKGIAFHYGNMPLLIRQEIERLFKEGDIKFLICTSTLLEGVNLPAKSIFIRKPTRGKGNPLNENDFWNLAGRAGRWGKEFSGNIICIEPQNWDIPPNPSKSKQTIIRAIDTIESNFDELINFIQADTPREIAYKRQDLESAFGYYYIRFLKNTLQKDKPLYARLFDIFMEVKTRILLPNYILTRNPGISPIAQQYLYNYFLSNIDDIENLIPVYPEDENALNEYAKLVGIIGQTISFYPEGLNISRAILLINWMQGKPLSFLISASYKSYQKNEKYKKIKTLPVVIRETMDNVETFVRFRFAKDSSCYIDILRYFLEINNKPSLLKRIPELNLWLEFGVSQKTHLSLLALGLTRNTVIELSAFITNSMLSKEECLIWIKENDIELMNLSPIIMHDIRKISN